MWAAAFLYPQKIDSLTLTAPLFASRVSVPLQSCKVFPSDIPELHGLRLHAQPLIDTGGALPLIQGSAMNIITTRLGERDLAGISQEEVLGFLFLLAKANQRSDSSPVMKT